MSRRLLPRELADRRAAGEVVYLLDVRQPEEHAIAAIDGGVLIPLGELAARIHEVQPPVGVAVVAYCHHGVRSLSAAAILERAGFTNVYSLHGGIDAWSAQVDPSVQRY
jgi:adenylyltransferase/sulfurtransferase